LTGRVLTMFAAAALGVVAHADVEEGRLALAREAIPEVVGRYAAVLAQLETGTPDPEASVRAVGRALWQAAVADDRPRDDRALYWGRLALRERLRASYPDQPELLAIAEHGARGIDDIAFPSDGSVRIFLTGFDPFFLDADIRQSNPSGFTALSLDGASLELGGRSAHIETVIVPVRFADFDAGLIESLMTPMFSGGADLVVTVSMGRDAFDLERFPALRRSATVPDNLRIRTGASATDPRPPRLGPVALTGPEFVEFSLPAGVMAATAGRWPVRDNRRVSTLERGSFEVRDLSELTTQTSVEGSGGGYLSNEISYRTIRLADELGSRVPVGHLHTPALAGYDHDLESRIAEAVRTIVASIPG
jgi:pyrrolidone-carboxylate peptidase